jgi:cyclopropane fatty-acyl-phospholipid synthase-like methyltransferase
MNPISEEKLDNFIELLNLNPGDSVLDIACGKGELLVKLVEKYGTTGVGVDKSPYCIKKCNQKAKERVSDANLVFYLMDGANYKSEKLFNLTCCVGASWIFSDHKGTLCALSEMTKPGGLILVGEPYWRKEPSRDYLEAEGMTRDSYRNHWENVKIGEKLGLKCIYTLDSDHYAWDHYETLHWWAVEDFLRENPDEPERKEIFESNERAKEIYLKWGRDTMGWSLYLFKNK